MKQIEYIGKCLLIESGGIRILAIGDLHIGYEEALEKSGVMIGRNLFDEMIAEFNKVFEKIEKGKGEGVDKIVILGDVKHEFSELNNQEWGDLLRLLEYLESKLNSGGEVVLIKGNHDNYLLNLRRKKKIEIKGHWIFGKYCFLHGDKDFPEIYDKKIKCWVMGHLHPAVKISEEGGAKEEKYKCFLEGKFKGKKIIIVPSFSSFSEGSDPRSEGVTMPWEFNFDMFDIKIVGEGLEVLDFGKLGEL